MKNDRNYNVDIIRIFAFFCVVAVHFFLMSGFYDISVGGKKMFIMSIFRNFFIICVPLFITLTGYLMCNKVLKPGYYKRLFELLLTYILCSIIYSIFKCLYYGDSFNFFEFLNCLLSYKGVSYAWYIEMYIGLFIMIPFLNLIFNNLNEKKDCQFLLASLLFIVSLPGMINIYNVHSIEWWYHPSVSNDYFKVIPSWWINLYPLLYYFLGAYIRRFISSIKIKYGIILLLFTCFLSGIFSFYRSYGVSFAFASWNDYSSLFTFILCALVFILFLNIKISYKITRLKKVLVVLSNACFGGFLLSCIFDQIFYEILAIKVPLVSDRFFYAPIIVLCVFVCSLLSSIVVGFFQSHFIRICSKYLKKDSE